ncbi:hypothetical protein FA13DRAFT_1731934 [Coprinellus micaceus]|uniref:Uncharacterized protein n=1 Tax=Coprinellus micaceus TaxID=71717 RepID=A0A4Y7TDD6_COPMI|nr:hypothetical protein FA13DRAFT_1731934 [Coprinellus micaceus]
MALKYPILSLGFVELRHSDHTASRVLLDGGYKLRILAPSLSETTPCTLFSSKPLETKFIVAKAAWRPEIYSSSRQSLAIPLST